MTEPAFRDGIHDFIRHVVSAISSASLYSPDHRQVHRLSEQALASLRSALQLEGEIVFLVIEDELVCNNVPLDGGLSAGKFMRLFASKGIGHLTFLRDIEPGELRELIVAMSNYGGNRNEVRSSEHVRLGRLRHGHGSEEGSRQEDDGNEILSLEEIRQLEREAFREIAASARGGGKFGVMKINGIVRSLIHAFDRMSMPVLACSVLSALDRYTYIHSTNVCILNLAQAMTMGIEGSLLHDIGLAGMFHDIGKLFIPDEVLSKPHGLSNAEKELIREHPVRGAHYLLGIPGVPRLAVVCAYEHHMRYDASGYPRAEAGWRQNVCSQMTAISDYFDALRTRRAYRDSVDHGTVAAMMLDGAGTLFEPLLARNFLRLLGSRRMASAPDDGLGTEPG